jgi:hypothetical protein
VVRLVVLEGLVGHGNAQRVVYQHLDRAPGDARPFALEWQDPEYVKVEPQRRRVEGVWRRPGERGTGYLRIPKACLDREPVVTRVVA